MVDAGVGSTTKDVRTVERCWDNWAVVTNLPMVPTFFEETVRLCRTRPTEFWCLANPEC